VHTTKLNREHLLGISCLIIAGVTFALAAQLPKGQSAGRVSGPALFPVILATILGLCGVAEIVIGFAKGAASPSVSFGSAVRQLKRREVINLLLIVGMLVVYELLFERLGFVLTTFLFLSVVMARLGVSVPRSLIYSAGYVVVIYLLFRTLFAISLPAGVLSLVGF